MELDVRLLSRTGKRFHALARVVSHPIREKEGTILAFTADTPKAAKEGALRKLEYILK